MLSSGSGRSYAAEVVAGGGFDLDGLAPFAGELLAKDVGILVDRPRPTDSTLIAAADAALERMGVARPRRDVSVTAFPPPMAGCAPVSVPDTAAPSASALRLVVAAERLFAQHGIDGVSLRQIAAEAGSANNSAVHYHFGSKQALIAAIFRHRLPQLINERRLLSARCDPDDLRSRLEAHFLPVFTLAEATDNHYVSFVEQIQRHDLASQEGLLDLPAEGQRSNDEFRADLDRLLDDLPEPLRQLRITEAQSLCIHAAADRERTVTSGPGRAVRALRRFDTRRHHRLPRRAASAATQRWLRGARQHADRALRLL